MSKLTNADFSRFCAYLAKDAAHWAGDTLILPEDLNEPVRPEAVARFTKEVRERLDHLESRAALAKESGQ